ncbi:MAG: SEL1-like repeat protein [Planctomycetota bacterium]
MRMNRCFRDGIVGVVALVGAAVFAAGDDIPTIRKRAEKGDAKAQCELGRRIQTGTGVEKNEAEAVGWFRKSAEQGDADGQYELGNCFDEGKGTNSNSAEAAAWYRKAAEKGHAGSQLSIGLVCIGGIGVEKDVVEGVKWLRKSAGQANAGAQLMLGILYYSGQDVKQDYAEAVKWFHKAADRGNAEAQNQLGFCYEIGRGVREDHAEAAVWYRKAVDQGHAMSRVSLGMLLQNGNGVRQDLNEAAALFQKAAEHGDKLGQYHLGKCYEEGLGRNVDWDQAMIWYRRSAAQGFDEAKSRLEELEDLTETKPSGELVSRPRPVAAAPVVGGIGEVRFEEKPPGEDDAAPAVSYRDKVLVVKNDRAGAQDYFQPEAGGRVHGDFEITATVDIKSGPATQGNGIFFRFADDNGFIFNVTADGRCALYQYKKGEYAWFTFVDGQKNPKFKHDAVETGRVNTLTAVVRGSGVLIKINDREIGRQDWNVNPTGTVGVYVSGGNVVEYSNFRIKALE